MTMQETVKISNKRIFRFFLCAFLVFLLFFMLGMTDTKRFYSGKTPLFTVKTVQLNDGGTKIYYGIGYQLIDWKIINDENTGDISCFVGRESHYLLGMQNPADGPSIDLEEIREK